MFKLKPIALVSGTVICAVGFFLFIPLITELIYGTSLWQSYVVPILIYLIVGGSLVIVNKSVELKISIKEASEVLIEVIGEGKVVHLEPRHEVKHSIPTFQKSIDILNLLVKKYLEID